MYPGSGRIGVPAAGPQSICGPVPPIPNFGTGVEIVGHQWDEVYRCRDTYKITSLCSPYDCGEPDTRLRTQCFI